MGDLESGEDGISLIPCGSGMENGKITRLKCPGRCIRKKPGCGRPVLPSASSEALGQVPGGSGLGVNAEDHGSWPMGWSFLYRIPVCDLPPRGRDQNIRFKVFRASFSRVTSSLSFFEVLPFWRWSATHRSVSLSSWSSCV